MGYVCFSPPAFLLMVINQLCRCKQLGFSFRDEDSSPLLPCKSHSLCSVKSGPSFFFFFNGSDAAILCRRNFYFNLSHYEVGNYITIGTLYSVSLPGNHLLVYIHLQLLQRNISLEGFVGNLTVAVFLPNIFLNL